MSGVVISGLRKAFGTHRVLAGLGLEVPDGSLTAVLGSSGSGKTTLLRILAGFEHADAGSITVGGALVADEHHHLPPERRAIGYVPQDAALFPHLTVAGNVGFGLSRRQRRGSRVAELLDLVGLAGHGQRYPHQISGGQQQRVALARALAPSPRLVLLDEPFSSLDAALRTGLRRDVARALKETGSTALLVTHDQDEALSLADRIAVLRDGHIAQCARPEHLYSHPVDPAMAHFIGDANLLAATVGNGQAVTALGTLPLSEHSRCTGEAQHVIALVRPEQIQIHTGPGRAGLRGRVAEAHYFGHDLLVAVDTGQPRESHIRVRLTGQPPIPVGTAVSLTATGPVIAWPAEREQGA